MFVIVVSLAGRRRFLRCAQFGFFVVLIMRTNARDSLFFHVIGLVANATRRRIVRLIRFDVLPNRDPFVRLHRRRWRRWRIR